MYPDTKYRNLFSFQQKEIQNAYRQARRRAQMPGLKLLQEVASDSKRPRCGKLLIVLSSKSGKSHERNRLKRRIKAIFYEEKLYQKAVRSILIVYKEAIDIPQEELKTFLRDALQ